MIQVCYLINMVGYSIEARWFFVYVKDVKNIYVIGWRSFTGISFPPRSSFDNVTNDLQSFLQARRVRFCAQVDPDSAWRQPGAGAELLAGCDQSPLCPAVRHHLIARYAYHKGGCQPLFPVAGCFYPIGLSYPPDWGERTMSLRPTDDTELKSGMTFHFMPGLWLDAW